MISSYTLIYWALFSFLTMNQGVIFLQITYYCRIHYIRVYLCGFHALMSQKFLHSCDIDTIIN